MREIKIEAVIENIDPDEADDLDMKFIEDDIKDLLKSAFKIHKFKLKVEEF